MTVLLNVLFLGTAIALPVRYLHLPEEHLLPLHVCAGMAGKTAKVIFDDYIFGKRAVAFLW